MKPAPRKATLAVMTAAKMTDNAGSTEPMKKLEESNPVQVAEYCRGKTMILRMKQPIRIRLVD